MVQYYNSYVAFTTLNSFTDSNKETKMPLIKEDTDFIIEIEQEESSGSRSHKWIIYDASIPEDDRSYSNRFEYGWSNNKENAERIARKKIDQLMRPYRPKPKLTNFVPPIVKRVSQM